ncbi:hypothetical protein LCGC14_2240640 [marine sediment metagenome]|uniref:4Fe-4S ferredoxin-type domain-containing protein n=1 Tax=marine sediment metagenome TaxID=412755 RepID=A0A0F9D5R8_9ZZZZ
MENSKEKGLSRRQLLKLGTLGAATLVTFNLTKKVLANEAHSQNPRFGMVIDLRRCTSCHACSVACKSEFDVPLGGFRSWVRVREQGKYPQVKKKFLPRLCNHCDDPPCVPVCPVNATYALGNGTVIVDGDVCIGCKACISACPYNSRFLNPITHTTNKCDLCLHRIENGVVPACVNACPADARTFGDLGDKDSEAAKLLVRNATVVLKPELGTKPQVFYIPA